MHPPTHPSIIPSSMAAQPSKLVRIGGFSAFWGDTPTAAGQLLHSETAGRLDYLIGDYLAEVTLCILARLKKSRSGTGYVREFIPTVFLPFWDRLRAQGTILVTNAGGMDPLGLKEAMEAAAREHGKPTPNIAVVLGDDLTPQAEALRKNGAFQSFAVLDGAAEPLWEDTPMSCNAYLGAIPIAAALGKGGVDIVITGRTVDSALVLGPLIHEFGWGSTDYDLLSGGSLAGHLIECGAQVTGGNFTDWRDSRVDGWSNVGFPIVECRADGSCVVTKPSGTGGLVSVGTVSEQMLYEILDPREYQLPDVVCDWTQVRLLQLPEQDGSGTVNALPSTGRRCSNRVLVSGAKGRPPSLYYKVGTTTVRGWTASAQLLISGFEAAEKAQAVADAILDKTRALFQKQGLPDYTRVNVELLGAEHTYGPRAAIGARGTREIVLRLSVIHPERLGCRIFGLEIAPVATALAPGITGAGAGRPKPTPTIHYHSALLRKSLVEVSIQCGAGEPVKVSIPSSQGWTPVDTPEQPFLPASSVRTRLPADEDWISAQLIDLCYGRSGDKGDVCNIGIIARRPEFFPFLLDTVTAETVQEYLRHLLQGQVERYSLPGVGGLNFVCTKALGGGGVESLQIDRQGKSYAQKLLSLPIRIPRVWMKELRSRL